jgi:hypothetical protein
MTGAQPVEFSEAFTDRQNMRRFARLWRMFREQPVAPHYLSLAIEFREFSKEGHYSAAPSSHNNNGAASLFFVPATQGKSQRGLSSASSVTSGVNRMRKVCAWCQADLGEVEGPGNVTHGMCQSCHDKALALVGV